MRRLVLADGVGMNAADGHPGRADGVVSWAARSTPVIRGAAPATPLAAHLEAVGRFLTTHVAYPSEHEPVAVALWSAHTHLADRADTSPILAVTSAEPQSGKTRQLDVLEILVEHPWRCVLPSEAVTYSMLARRPRPTMLLDEADAIFGPRTSERHEGLRAILNSGNRQGTPVYRVQLDGRRRHVEAFDVFGPKAIAAIGDLPPTVADRAIPIRLRRRRPDEPVAKFRRRSAEAAASELSFDWDAVEVASTAEVPDELPDRAADNWEALLAIADAAGGEWPRRARLAAVALSSEAEVPVTFGIRLLSDIAEVFGDADHLATAELLERLHDLDGAPWAEWWGKPLTARGLARLLEPYRITPSLRRLGGERRRGYFRSDFADAWARYVTDVTDATGPSARTAGADIDQPVVWPTPLPPR